jgi:hypothetical protein
MFIIILVLRNRNFIRYRPLSSPCGLAHWCTPLFQGIHAELSLSEEMNGLISLQSSLATGRLQFRCIPRSFRRSTPRSRRRSYSAKGSPASERPPSTRRIHCSDPAHGPAAVACATFRARSCQQPSCWSAKSTAMMFAHVLRGSARLVSSRPGSSKSLEFVLIVTLHGNGYRCCRVQRPGNTRSYSTSGRTCTRRMRCYRYKPGYAERLTWPRFKRNRQVDGIKIAGWFSENYSTNGCRGPAWT